MEPRSRVIERLASGDHPDIVIIGGGANGAGLFRDLCLQGVPTLLVEKGDFSSGTSAAPTRLAHGGLRYLETGEVSLVRESAEERNLLLINAPHQVRPLTIWVPLRSWIGGTVGAVLRFFGLTKSLGPKGALAVKAGLMIYDRFGDRHRTMPRHSVFSRQAARELVPQLSPKTRLVAQYHDALMTQPERLVMELIEDGERDCPKALAISYAKAVGLVGGALAIRDVITGEIHQVKPRLVLNIAGAWADQVQSGLGCNQPMIGGTKGSHIIVRNRQLADALDGRMLYFEANDYRACIVLPLGGDRLFLGATDLRTDDPEDRHCSDDEIDYLFGVMKAVLPDIDFKREDIVYTITGVRPLPRSDGVDAGSISRDHKLHEFPPSDDRSFPVFTLIGGKWTTYRACAAQIADSVLAHLGMERKASTKNLSIGGGLDFPRGDEAQATWARDLASRTGLDPERADVLAWRYGSRAAPIAEAEAASSGGRIPGAETYSRAEIEWICRNERVTRLDDIVLRRTLIAFEGLVTRSGLTELAAIAGAVLGWSPERITEEIETASDLLTDRHRMRLEAA